MRKPIFIRKFKATLHASGMFYKVWGGVDKSVCDVFWVTTKKQEEPRVESLICLGFLSNVCLRGWVWLGKDILEQCQPEQQGCSAPSSGR